MQIEIRADGVHISGYVNATEKKSRPVITPHGKVIEEIEPRAFQSALDKAENILLTKDHDPDYPLAETRAGTLKLYEDSIGLHADAFITDPQTMEEAKKGKIRGWSFGMYNVKDELEQRAEQLPLRKVKSFDMDHITLVVKKVPAYCATSIEVRADAEIEMELRNREDTPKVTEAGPFRLGLPAYNNSAFRARVEAIRK